MYHFREYSGFLLSKIEEQILEEIHENLSKDFEVNFNPNFTFNFKKFAIFNHISVVNPFLCFDVAYDSEHFQIVALNIQYNYIGGKRGDSLINENQIWGLKTLKNNYGNIFLRDENIYDKVAEIFNKTEIDFQEDKEFSNRYYLVSDQVDKTRFSFNSKIRSYFKEIPKSENYIFEIAENIIIVGNRKPINQYYSHQIANFLKNKF